MNKTRLVRLSFAISFAVAVSSNVWADDFIRLQPGDFASANWYNQTTGQGPNAGPPGASDNAFLGGESVTSSGTSVLSVGNGTLTLSGDFNAPTLTGGLTLSGNGKLMAQTGSAAVNGGHLQIQNYTASPIINISNGGSIVAGTIPDTSQGAIVSGGSLNVAGMVKDMNLTLQSGGTFRAPNVDNGRDVTVTINDAGSHFTVDQQFAVKGGFLDIDGGMLTVGGQLGLDGGTSAGGQPIGGGGHWQGSNARISTSEPMFVGLQTGTFSLAIDGGAFVNTGGVVVGAAPGSSGTITMSGGATVWEVSASTMTIGQSGKGSFAISAGADLRFDSATTLLIGKNSGADGKMTLDGSGTQLDARNAFVAIGDNAGSKGSLLLSTAAQLLVEDNCLVGNHGQGSISLTSGSQMAQEGAANDFVVGNFPGASGSISIQGPGTGLSVEAVTQIGNGGHGSIGVGNGGTVDSFTVSVGVESGGDGSVLLGGTNSTWSIDGNLIVGFGGTGQWTTQGGAHLNLPVKPGYFHVGHRGGASGSFTLMGAGSNLTVAQGKMGFGIRGQGSGIVKDAATAQTKIVGIGVFTGSNGLLTITGAGSTWNGPQSMCVSGLPRHPGGVGELAVNGGGTLRVGTTLFVGGQGVVRGTGQIAVGSGGFGPPGTLRLSAGGILTGSGRVSIQVIVAAGGRIVPGSSPGLLAIEGNYVQEPTGTLDVEIGGTAPGSGFDQIQVSGAATLAGNLNVRLVNGFTPSIGQTYRILTAASVSGNFSSITGPGNAGISVAKDATGVTVTITSVVAGAPVISSPTTVVATPGVPFTYQIAATKSPTSFGATNLPAGLTVNNTTGVISGTSTAPGVFVVPMAANNSAGSGQADLILLLEDLNFEDPGSAVLLNIATRLRVLTGDNVLIGGFIITGTDPKKVIIRGIGPSLAGIAGTLPNPTLVLKQGDTTIASNDDWKEHQAEVEATTIPPTNDLESAIVTTLNPGAYTAILADKNGGNGVGVVELYDLAQGANSKLANISSRGFVDTGDNVMIGGLIVGGSGTANVIVRAIGPSLGAVGVSGALQDPTLELRNSSGALLASNDNWKLRSDGSSQQAEIEATTIPPTNDLESAILSALAPGNYTAIVRGKNNTTGIAVVEVYNLP